MKNPHDATGNRTRNFPVSSHRSLHNTNVITKSFERRGVTETDLNNSDLLIKNSILSWKASLQGFDIFPLNLLEQ
jgi:hypothetical protein